MYLFSFSITRFPRIWGQQCQSRHLRSASSVIPAQYRTLVLLFGGLLWALVPWLWSSVIQMVLQVEQCWWPFAINNSFWEWAWCDFWLVMFDCVMSYFFVDGKRVNGKGCSDLFYWSQSSSQWRIMFSRNTVVLPEDLHVHVKLCWFSTSFVALQCQWYVARNIQMSPNEC